MSKPQLHDLPARYQAQALAQLHGTPRPRTVKIEPVEDAPKKRLRQSASGLNKTEAAYLEVLKEDHPGAAVLSQSITLRLANGVRYTPDFVVAGGDVAGVCAHEVKGFMRDDAAVKLKVAASLYPWIRFFLVSRAKGGMWHVQEVLP